MKYIAGEGGCGGCSRLFCGCAARGVRDMLLVFWRFEGVRVARWAVGGVRGRNGERGAENGVNEDEDGKWRAKMWGDDGVNVGVGWILGRIWGVFSWVCGCPWGAW